MPTPKRIRNTRSSRGVGDASTISQPDSVAPMKLKNGHSRQQARARHLGNSVIDRGRLLPGHPLRTQRAVSTNPRSSARALGRQPMLAQQGGQVARPLFRKEQPSPLQFDEFASAGNGVLQPTAPLRRKK